MGPTQKYDKDLLYVAGVIGMQPSELKSRMNGTNLGEIVQRVEGRWMALRKLGGPRLETALDQIGTQYYLRELDGAHLTYTEAMGDYREALEQEVMMQIH